MSGYFFSNLAMICFQIAVRGPPLLSQKTILPLPDPSDPEPDPSSPHAVADRARASVTATAATPRTVGIGFIRMVRIS